MRRYPQEKYLRELEEGCERKMYLAYERTMAFCLPHLGGDIDGVLVVDKELDALDVCNTRE